MNVKLLVGIAFFLFGLILAVIGIMAVGTDVTRPQVGTATSLPLAAELQRFVVPALAGLALAAGGLLIGLSLGNWKHPRAHLEPGDEVVNPEGYHKMKHV
jgi:hypothetical protein